MKKIKYIVIFEIFLGMILYNVNYSLRITPYRLSILRDYYRIIFIIVLIVFFVNLFLLFRNWGKNNLKGLFLIMVFVSALYSYSSFKDYKLHDLHENKVNIELVDYYLYSDHKLNDFGFFEVDYYLAHPSNDRYLIEGAVIKRHYQEEFLETYPKDYNYFVSSENIGILKEKSKDKNDAQIPEEPTYPKDDLKDGNITYEDIDNKNVKFRLKNGASEYAFLVTNRAGNAELVEVYKSTNKKNWTYVNSLAETSEIYNVLMPKENLFIFNYSSTYTDGRMNLFISDSTFDEMIPVSVPFESANDVYLEDAYIQRDKILIKASGPSWNYGNTRSFYESSDGGLTWSYIKTENR